MSGITYYSELKNHNSITNPIIGSDVFMGFSGHFDEIDPDIRFDAFGYGLRKTKSNQGLIYCEDSSKLFSSTNGYVGILLNLPEKIENGVYLPLKSDNSFVKKYLLWGVNIGDINCYAPAIYAELTKEGIEFSVWTSFGKYSVTNDISNSDKKQDIFLEFIWNSSGILEFNYNDGYIATMCIRVNNEDIVVGNMPIANNNILNLPFCVLDNKSKFFNLNCEIKKLIIGNREQSPVEDAWYSSSSSSSSSSFSSSSSSSSSSFSFDPDAPAVGRNKFVVVFSLIDESSAYADNAVREGDIIEFNNYVGVFPPKLYSKFVGICVSGSGCQNVFPGPPSVETGYINRNSVGEWSILKAFVDNAVADWETNYDFDSVIDKFYILFWVDSSGSMTYDNVSVAIDEFKNRIAIDYGNAVVDSRDASDGAERWIRGLKDAYKNYGDLTS